MSVMWIVLIMIAAISIFIAWAVCDTEMNLNEIESYCNIDKRDK